MLNSYSPNIPWQLCIALYCIVLHCIALHCIALHCIALHCIALHCIALHCIALHCIALHCIALLAPVYQIHSSSTGLSFDQGWILAETDHGCLPACSSHPVLPYLSVTFTPRPTINPYHAENKLYKPYRDQRVFSI